MSIHAKISEELCGPVTLEESFPFVAYVFHGEADSPAICLTAHLDDHKLLLNWSTLRPLLYATLRNAKERYKDWLKIPCLVGHVQAGGKEIAVNVYEGSETEPKKIAKAALRTRTRVLVREVDGQRYVVTQYAPEPGEAVCRYELRSENDRQLIGTLHLTWDDFERIDNAIRVAMPLKAEGVMSRYDFGSYLFESELVKDPIEAFHSFYHAQGLADASGTPLVIAAGLDVAVRLLGFYMWDYAEWVAGAVSRLAESVDSPSDRVKALRLKGIACSHLGRFDDTVKCFESALADLPRPRDLALESQVRMSYGLALMDLLAHWETLDLDERRRANAVLGQRLDLAERELHAAKEILSETKSERANRNLRFLNLDLLRIRDLRGDHTGARRELEYLKCDNDYSHSPLTDEDIDQIKYEATVLHYSLAAAQKAAEGDDRSWLQFLVEDLPRAATRMNRLPTKRPVSDRLCCLMALSGQCIVNFALDLGPALAQPNQGNSPSSEQPAVFLDPEKRSWILKMLEVARKNLEEGLKLQYVLKVGNLAPGRPGLDYGGLSVIDFAGMLQSAQILLAAYAGQPELSWKALGTADMAKGRFFRRDLAFSAARMPETVSPSVVEELQDLRDALVADRADHRVVMAEHEWATRHNLSTEQAKAYREDTSFEEELDRKEIEELLEGLKVPTALLSLYANRKETLAYLATSAQPFPKVYRLEVDIGSLEGRARSLYAGIAGGEGAGPIDALRPWQRDEYFKPLQELRDLVKPMMPHFAGISRIVISPHGPWHGLPLHALLLPLLWNDRQDTGISYAPCLRALHLLQKRERRMAQFAREPIAMATVPAAEDKNSEGKFQREHRLFTQLFRRTNRTILSTYGVAATRSHILEEMRNAGLCHLLAHGLDAGAGNAMKSGLLVANNQGLPSRVACSTASSYPTLTAALAAANGTAASHITLQACSLGRLHLAPGDEIWGMTRALLAGGADTVLAPLWDVDLQASSSLLRRFYLHWLLGDMPAWLALGTAQREMATGRIKAFRHFYHWGAFQLVGC